MNNGPWRQSFLSMDPGSQSGASVLAVILTSITHDLGQRGRDADRAGEIGPFEAMRIRRVEAGDAFDRRLEVIEAAFLRSAERRVGQECVSTCRSRSAPSHYKTTYAPHTSVVTTHAMKSPQPKTD